MSPPQEPDRTDRRRPAGMGSGHARHWLRDDDPPQQEPAAGGVAKAAAALAGELARCARSGWRALPRFFKRLLVWVGMPSAVAVFSVSVAYHLLGAYAVYQSDTVKQAKSRAKKLTAERNRLRQELEEARAEAEQAKADAERARKELAHMAGVRDASRERGVAAQERGPGPTPERGVAGTGRKVSMPCAVSGTAGELAARLKDCVGEFDRRLGG